MSLLFGRQRRDLGDTPSQLVPPRRRSIGSVTVGADSALRASAMWACLRLRADLVSSMPIAVVRQVDGYEIEMPSTAFLTDPAGDGYGLPDWLYSSQIDLDRFGNSVGVVTARDGLGLPAQVELQPREQVTVKGTGSRITGWRIAGKDYDPRDIWHERQFTVPGVPLGLSLIAYAAWTLGQYQSAQQFGLDWFANGRIPAGRLKNTSKKIDPAEAKVAKDRFRSAVENRDLFVHGADWEYDMIAVNDGESQFLDTMRFGILDVARFCGVPGDLIDAEAQSSAKITYANITQRNLQLLVMNLNPTLVRREWKLTTATPRPRRVIFKPDSTLLRMDPQTRQLVTASMIQNRQLAIDEARAQDNRPPLTQDQVDEFAALFGKAAPTPADLNPAPPAK